MKKVKKSISKEYPLVKLYREDLEDIFQLLAENGFNEIKLETEDYELNPGELSDLKEKELCALKIHTYNPFYITISLDSTFATSGVKVYCGDDSTKAVGIVEKIGRILIKRKRLLFTFMNKLQFAFLVTFTGETIAFVVTKYFYNPHLADSIIVASFLFIISAVILSTGLLFRKNIIVLTYKRDQQGFFTRNRDAIILLILGALLTAILTSLK